MTMTDPRNLVEEMVAKGPLIDAGNCNAGKVANEPTPAQIAACAFAKTQTEHLSRRVIDTMVSVSLASICSNVRVA